MQYIDPLMCLFGALSLDLISVLFPLSCMLLILKRFLLTVVLVWFSLDVIKLYTYSLVQHTVKNRIVIKYTVYSCASSATQGLLEAG